MTTMTDKELQEAVERIRTRLKIGPHNTTIGGMVEYRMTMAAAQELQADLDAALSQPPVQEERKAENIGAQHSRAISDLELLRDRWDQDCSMGEAYDMSAEWVKSAEWRAKRVQLAIDLLKTDQPPAALHPAQPDERVGQLVEALTKIEAQAWRTDAKAATLLAASALIAHNARAAFSSPEGV